MSAVKFREFGLSQKLFSEFFEVENSVDFNNLFIVLLIRFINFISLSRFDIFLVFQPNSIFLPN